MTEEMKIWTEKDESEWWQYRKTCHEYCGKCSDKYRERCNKYDLEVLFGEGGA